MSNDMWHPDGELDDRKYRLRERRGPFGDNKWKMIAFTSLALVVILISFVAFLTIKVFALPTATSVTPAVLHKATPTSPAVGVTPTSVLPTATPLPPTPTSTLASTLPCIVNVGAWAGGSSDWKTLNGMLLNDGSIFTNATAPTIIAPCQLNVPDYAVEAKIQVVSPPSGYGGFGIVARATSTNNNWQGYVSLVDVVYGVAEINAVGDSSSLGTFDFSAGKNAHVYRIEVKGNSISYLIDGTKVLTATDNRILSPGEVGLWCSKIQIEVTSFKVVAL